MFVAALLAADFAAFLAACATAYWLLHGVFVLTSTDDRTGMGAHGSVVAVVGLLWLAVFSKFGLYQIRRGWELADLLFSATYAVSVAMVCFLATSYLLGWLTCSLLLLGLVWANSIVGIVGVRLFFKRALLLCRDRGIGVRRVVIVGDRSAGRSLRETIDLHPELGYETVALLSPAAEGSGCATAGEAVYYGTPALVQHLVNDGIDDVIITLPVGRNRGLLEFIAACQESGISVRLVPDLYETFSLSPELEAIENIPLLTLRHAGLFGWERLGKRLLDLAIAPVLLAVTLPVVLGLAAVLRRRRGRAFERVVRVGEHGASFGAWRLAVPVRAAARRGYLEEWAARYSITEIPQLWNVMRGEMSLVGPRPEEPERVRRYNAWHRRRLVVKPGLTGLAQVNGLRAFASSDEKTRFDVQYIDQRSLRLDLRLLLQTACTILSRMRGELHGSAAAGHREALVPGLRPPEPLCR